MQQIEFSSNYGNFGYTLRANIGENVNPETVLLAREQGLGNLGYRVCGSSVDKAFGVKGKNPVFDKRTDVPYTHSNVGVMSTAVKDAIAKLVEKEPLYGKLGLTVEITGEHVASGGGEASRKTAENMAFLVIGNEAALKQLGLGLDATKEQVVEALHGRLMGDRKKKAKTAVVDGADEAAE